MDSHHGYSRIRDMPTLAGYTDGNGRPNHCNTGLLSFCHFGDTSCYFQGVDKHDITEDFLDRFSAAMKPALEQFINFARCGNSGKRDRDRDGGCDGRGGGRGGRGGCGCHRYNVTPSVSEVERRVRSTKCLSYSRAEARQRQISDGVRNQNLFARNTKKRDRE